MSRGNRYDFPTIRTIGVTSYARISEDSIRMNKIHAYYDDRSVENFSGIRILMKFLLLC